MVTGLADRRSGIACCPRDRVDVRDHFGRCTLDALPAFKDVLKELDIFGRVDSGDRRETMFAGRDRARSRPGPGEQPFDPLRLFRIGQGRAARQEGVWVVAFLLLGVEGLHQSPVCRQRMISVGKRQESIAMDGVAMVGRVFSRSPAFNKSLGGYVSDVDREPQMGAPLSRAIRQRGADQSLADLSATKTAVDLEILDVEAGAPSQVEKIGK